MLRNVGVQYSKPILFVLDATLTILQWWSSTVSRTLVLLCPYLCRYVRCPLDCDFSSRASGVCKLVARLKPQLLYFKAALLFYESCTWLCATSFSFLGWFVGLLQHGILPAHPYVRVVPLKCMKVIRLVERLHDVTQLLRYKPILFFVGP